MCVVVLRQTPLVSWTLVDVVIDGRGFLNDSAYQEGLFSGVDVEEPLS
jgi:hypothetical protein